MALIQFSVSPTSIGSSSSSASSPSIAYSPAHLIIPSPSSCTYKDYTLSVSGSPRNVDLKRKSKWVFAVRSSLDGTSTTAAVGQVTEVTKDTFWPIVKSAGDKAVVLDMYTQWCGPCKVMAPKFQALSEKYDDVIFLKLDCNKDNKPLAKELGIRVVPTFKILKDSKIVKEVTGAKYDDLVLAIETVRSS